MPSRSKLAINSGETVSWSILRSPFKSQRYFTGEKFLRLRISTVDCTENVIVTGAIKFCVDAGLRTSMLSGGSRVIAYGTNALKATPGKIDTARRMIAICLRRAETGASLI